MAKNYSSMVFQQFNLYPHMTVLQNLTLAPIKLQKVPKKEAEENAMKYLERVGLADKANCYPQNLSGGQQQRVAIARALCTNCLLYTSLPNTSATFTISLINLSFLSFELPFPVSSFCLISALILLS